MKRPSILMVLVVIAGFGVVATAQDSQPPAAVATTPGGVEFGLWGKPSEKPAPILFVLAGTIEGTLGSAYFRQCGNSLAAEHGYRLVSIDIPCHGKLTGEGKPSGLGGWAQLAAKGENFVADCNARLSAVLDHLIETGVADPQRVAACGISRGGFLAVHFAAHDPRIKCAAAFAPVTDLAALNEFTGKADIELVQKLSLENQADRLAGRAVWIVIGDQDARVSTRAAIEVAQAITTASIEQKLDSRVELHVMPEPRGHTTPKGSAERAAEWIHRQMAESNG